MNMAEKKTENFTVTDRRLFTSEGELRTETPEEEPSTPAATATPAQAEQSAPQAPSADEQKQQA